MRERMRVVTAGKCIGPAVLIGLILAAACLVSAGESERPAITRIDLHLDDGHLAGDVTSTGILSERIVGTVESGLPAVVQLFYHLVESSGRPVHQGLHSYSLEYDVWDDVYSIEARDSTMILPTLEAMRSMIQRIENITLAPAGKMLPQRSYVVQMSIAVQPLRGSEAKEMTGWVMRNVEGGGSSWHEQVLSVNELIEHFFSSEDNSPMRSNWFKSEPFIAGSLPGRDKGEK